MVRQPPCQYLFFANISERADGEPPRIPKDAAHRDPFGRHPSIRSSPSAFAVGMRRKVVKNRSAKPWCVSSDATNDMRCTCVRHSFLCWNMREIETFVR